MTQFHRVLQTGLLVLPFAMPLAATAQTTAPTSTPAPTTAAPMPKMARHDPAAGVEQRIAQLHAKLKITPVQQPQWDEFAGIMRTNAQAMSASFQQRATQVTAMSAADNMQSYAQLAAEHAQQMQALAGSFGKLYASLDVTQKKLADDAFRQAAARHS